MAIESTPVFIQAGSHPAALVRRALGGMLGHRGGILTPYDLLVSQRSAGANMSIDVGEGMVAVLGQESAYQGTYIVEARGITNLSISAADATLARRDLVIVRVRDSEYSGGTDEASIEVVTGTPSGSPSDPALPSGTVFVLARVAVAAGATSISSGSITDLRRTYAADQYGLMTAAGGTRICTSGTRPSDPHAGMTIFEIDTNRTYVCNGVAWVLMSTGGAYTPYTPTLGNITLGSGGVAAARWKVVDGSTLFLRARITLGTGGSFSGAGTISLPSGMAGVTETDAFQIVPAILRDTGTLVYKGHVQLLSGGSTLTIYADGASGTYLTQNATAAGAPHTWASTDVIAFHGAFEIDPYTVAI